MARVNRFRIKIQKLEISIPPYRNEKHNCKQCCNDKRRFTVTSSILNQIHGHVRSNEVNRSGSCKLVKKNLYVKVITL